MGFRFQGCHTLAAFIGADFLIPFKYSLKTDFFGAAVRGFREKMASAEAQRQYLRLGRVVDFCHAWIKSKLGLRQFHVCGLIKVQTELLWACLTYNLQHRARLNKLRSAPAAS